jgi:hypothetical protein
MQLFFGWPGNGWQSRRRFRRMLPIGALEHFHFRCIQSKQSGAAFAHEKPHFAETNSAEQK